MDAPDISKIISLKVGDRVRYIREDTEDDKKTGYYPPVGTLGTVTNIDEKGPEVKWDSGTEGDGEWWCDYEDVELVYHYIIEVLIDSFRFLCNCATAEMALEALEGIFKTIPNTKRDDVDFEKILNEMEYGERVSYNECPIAICRINGECK